MKEIVFVIPLISAFIGYITNYIAIGMLFRPYKEIKLFGIKIFGKGVIPRNHEKLAESIGRTVAQELLSSEDILRKLNSEKINIILKETITRKLIELLSKNPQSLKHLLPYELHYLEEDLRNKLSELFAEKFISYFKENKTKISLLISSLIKKISGNSFGKIISDAEINLLRKKIKIYVSDKVEDLLNAENMIPKIEEYLVGLSKSEKNVREIIPGKLDAEIRNNIPVITLEIVKQLKIILNKEETQEEIKNKLSDFSSSLLENANLGMLSMFITTDFIQDKINLLVSKGIPYLEDNLDSEEYREKISGFVISIYDDYSNKKIVDLFEGYLNIDDSHTLGNVASVLNDIVFNSKNISKINEEIAKYLDKDFGNLVNSFSEYLGERSNDFGTIIYQKIGEYLDSNSRQIKEYSDKIIDFAFKLKLPKLTLLVTSNDIESLSHYILKVMRNQMEIYLPQIFSTLDIKGIVTEKVLGFPLPKLEKIIKDVAGKELKYITYFGAVLGFLIGLIQIIFVYL